MFHKTLMIVAALGMLLTDAQAAPTSPGYAHQGVATKIAGSGSVPAPAAPAGEEIDVFGLGASRPCAPALAQAGGFDDFDAPAAPADADRPWRP